MSTYRFYIIKNNIITLNANGDSIIKIEPNDLIIPQNIKGLPYNLQSLVSFVGPSNINITYYVMAYGSASKHSYVATYILYAYAVLLDKSVTPKSLIAKTVNDANIGSPINTGWISLNYNGPQLISTLHISNICDDGGNGSKCACIFQKQGGWSGTTISLRVDVSVNLLNFCTKEGTENIYYDMCYDFINGYVNGFGSGTNEQIDNYIKEYCKKNIQ